jgi:hypothetical protein
VIRAVAVAAVGLALVAAGCGSRRAPPMSASWQLSAACRDGTRGCLPSVVAAMSRRYRPLAAACDHNAAFALMYLRVTEAVGRRGSSFADGRYLARLDAVFAGLYFDASDAWRAGRRERVPPAWRIAFEAADRRRATGIGDLLLGMNAHISRDLPFALVALGSRGRADRRSFEQVNSVLEHVARSMLREQARRFDATVASFALPVLSASPRTLGTVLAGWRDAAFADAQRLRRARTAFERRAATASIEQTAAARAALIAAATSRVPYSREGKARERQCRSRGVG